MTTENLRGLVRRQPFEPFVIHMSDGRKFTVTHPDYVALPPEGLSSTFMIWTKPESFEILSTRQVTGVASKGEAPPLPKRRKSSDSDE